METAGKGFPPYFRVLNSRRWLRPNKIALGSGGRGKILRWTLGRCYEDIACWQMSNGSIKKVVSQKQRSKALRSSNLVWMSSRVRYVCASPIHPINSNCEDSFKSWGLGEFLVFFLVARYEKSMTDRGRNGEGKAPRNLVDLWHYKERRNSNEGHLHETFDAKEPVPEVEVVRLSYVSVSSYRS